LPRVLLSINTYSRFVLKRIPMILGRYPGVSVFEMGISLVKHQIRHTQALELQMFFGATLLENIIL
jgi:hypothetical protein